MSVAAPRQRRVRTPEEIAKSIEVAKAVMQNQKKMDGIESVKSGRRYVYLAGIYYLIHAVVMYLNDYTEDFYVFGGLTVFYVVFGFVYFKNPFIISIVAFAFFILIIVLQAMVNPLTLFGGLLFFILKVSVIAGLIAAMRNAIRYKKELEAEENKKTVQSEILDDALIDFK